jgi:hypothetical protein
MKRVLVSPDGEQLYYLKRGTPGVNSENKRVIVDAGTGVFEDVLSRERWIAPLGCALNLNQEITLGST